MSFLSQFHEVNQPLATSGPQMIPSGVALSMHQPRASGIRGPAYAEVCEADPGVVSSFCMLQLSANSTQGWLHEEQLFATLSPTSDATVNLLPSLSYQEWLRLWGHGC